MNDKGGLNGHPVELLVADDGLDPARHRSLVQEFVERRGVIAFLNNYEVFAGENSVEYLVSKRIPVIGGPLIQSYFYDHSTYFPQGTNGDLALDLYFSGAAKVAVPQGKHKLAILSCTEVPECKNSNGNAALKRAAIDAGFSVVYSASASFAQPDYTAECLNAEKAGAQVFFYILEGASARRLAGSCARQGYRPVYTTGAAALGEEEIRDPNLDGAIFPSPVFSRVLGSTPSSAEFQDVLRKYLPGKTTRGLSTYGWVGSKVLERGASNLSEPPTSESLLAALWSIKDDDLGGLTQPLTFDREKGATQMICWFTDTIHNGRLTPLEGGRRWCRP